MIAISCLKWMHGISCRIGNVRRIIHQGVVRQLWVFEDVTRGRRVESESKMHDSGNCTDNAIISTR